MNHLNEDIKQSVEYAQKRGQNKKENFGSEGTVDIHRHESEGGHLGRENTE